MIKDDKQITLRHFKIFVEVCNNQSVTKAAEILNIPQPSISRTIKEIEEHYNVRLFERINKRIQPTNEGQVLYNQAQHLIDYYNRMEKSLFTSQEHEVIKLGSSIRLGADLMPKLVSEFHKTHPGVETYVKISNQQVLEYKLMRNELDIAFCESILDPDQFVSRKLGEDELVVVVPKNHPLRKKTSMMLEELLDYPLLVREEGSSSRELLKHVLRSHGLVAKPIWESISTDAILKAVYNGLGITVLPVSLVSKYLKKDLLFTVPVENNPFIHNLYIVWHKDKFITDTTKELIDLAPVLYQASKNKE